MIAEPINITGRLTYEDLLEIHRFRIRATVRPSILMLMGIVSGALLALTVGISFQVPLKPPTYLVMGFFVYWPWGWLITREYAGRGRLRRAAAAATDHTATFTADSVSIATEDQASRVAWKRLKEIVETKSGLLFILPRGLVWFYLPWRVLHEKDYAEIVVTAAANNLRVRSTQQKAS